MRERWLSQPLGVICRFQAGDAFGKDAQGRSVGDHPFIKVSDLNLPGNELFITRANNWITDVEGGSSYRLHPANSVVFAKIGIALTYNRRRRLTRPTALDNNLMSATPLPNIDPAWFYYLLRTLDFNLIASGSALPYLTVKDLSRVSVGVPPAGDQAAIAEVLGALDDKIDLNRRMNETLEATARAIFKDWFVDFGPTRAKMEGRAPYLAPDLWALFPDRLDDEGKPEGWENSTVGAEFKLTMGQSPPGDTYNAYGEGLPFFQGRTDFGDRYPKRRMYCTAPTRLAEPDDTLVSVRAPVGDLNMAWERCCIGRGVAAVRHTSGSRSYTYYALGTLQPDLAAFEHTGTVFGAINKAQFEILGLVAPQGPLIAAFEESVASMDDRIRANVDETRTLAATRDLLLPKLMSGEIRVRDAEKIAEAAA